MKKLIILAIILFFGIQSYAQIQNDSLVSNQLTKEVVDKLSSDELILLIKDLEAMRYSNGVEFESDETRFIAQQFANPAFVKGIIISLIICMMLFIVLLISLPFYFNLKKTQSFHKMINGFTDKGQEIPQELLLSESRTKSDLHKSIVLISSGIAILLALLMLINHSRIWAVGIIPIVIGIGYYVVYRTVD